MKKIYFVVPGTPVAKARARSVIRAGRIAHYTPAKTASYESLVAMHARIAMNALEPFRGPIRLSCTFWLPVPMSYTKSRRKACLNGSERHCKKPDIDNLLTSIKDGCNNVAWVDDCQVVEVTASKHYAEHARAEIEICAD